MARSNKTRATVICRQRDKILLVRKAQAKWSLPGGTIEVGEGPAEAARRELCEETGLSSEALRFLALHEFPSRAHHVFFTHIPDALCARPQNEIADCRWFRVDDLPQDMVKKPSRELLALYGLFEEQAVQRSTFSGMSDSPWQQLLFSSPVC